MSSNSNGVDNTFWYTQLFDAPTANPNSNGTTEGSQATTSTLTTPVEPQGDWPIANSQDAEGTFQDWNPNSNPPPIPLPMNLSSNINLGMNNFGMEEHRNFSDVTGLGINSGLDQDPFSFSDNAVWENLPDNVSGGGSPFDFTIPGFDMSTPLAHAANNQNLSGDSGAPTDPRISNGLGNSSFNTANKFASGEQNSDAPQQNSTQQGEQDVDGANEEPMARHSSAHSTPTSRPTGSPKLTEGLPNHARTPGTVVASTFAGMQINHATTPQVIQQQQFGHQVVRQGNQAQGANQPSGFEQQQGQYGIAQEFQPGPRGVPPYPLTGPSSQFSNQGMPPSFGAPQQTGAQDIPETVFTSGNTRRSRAVRNPGQYRLIAPAPASAPAPPQYSQQTPRGSRPQDRSQDRPQFHPREQSRGRPRGRPQGRPQRRPQPTPQNQSRGSSGQSSSPQPSSPRDSSPLFPSRLAPDATAMANVAPATQFMESLSSMHLLDRMACIDLLMHSEHMKDYIKPHLWVRYDEGLAKGGRLAARSRLGMSDTVDEVARKHDGQNMKRRVDFQDKKIQNECRKRERAADMTNSENISGVFETNELAPSSSKRPRQTPGFDYGFQYEGGDDPFISNGDSDDESVVPPYHSPKKPRHTRSTPSDLVNKFCSAVNIGDRNPFFDDAIHSALRRLNLVRLIDPAPEYTAHNGELADTNVEHWRACAGQAAGLVLQDHSMCEHCAEHLGDGSVPFTTCVVIADNTPAGQELKGACMNCVYLGRDQECSLRWGEGEEAGAQ
ncbi:hypothetical protein NHQ30_008486 [Ciborinia camelliae]|nr:hypothetical protein NHQ30_008486 [Ciborinia camelliae]